jgi:hypothetical protein
MNTFTVWTRNEELILKNFWGRPEYPMDRIQELLPNRSAGAIQNRVKALGLMDPARRFLQQAQAAAEAGIPGFLPGVGVSQKSVEQLEAELRERKLAMELDTAEKQLSLFETTAIRNKSQFNDALVKERSKLTSRISQLRLRLFRIKLNNG